MDALLSTIKSIVIYTVPVILGILIGRLPGVRKRRLRWMDRLQFLTLMLLILSLGIRLGANDEIVASIGQIGLISLLLTLGTMAGSLLAVTLLRRFVLRLDRYGCPRGSGHGETETGGSAGKANYTMTWCILGAVAAGMAAGYFFCRRRWRTPVPW